MLKIILVSFFGFTMAFWPAYPTDMSSGISLARPTDGQRRRKFSAAEGRETVKRAISAQAGVITCNCQKEIQILDMRIRSGHALLERVQQKVDDLDNIVYNLRTIVRDFNAENRRNAEQEFARPFTIPAPISFSARVSNNRALRDPTATIIFDETTINNGEAYDPFTGIFTAPIDGVYHFSSTILSDFNSTIETMMMVNGEEIGRMFSGAFLSRGSGSNNILVNLKEDDKVSINVFYGNGDYVHGLWSTFMGYLVNQLFYNTKML